MGKIAQSLSGTTRSLSGLEGFNQIMDFLRNSKNTRFHAAKIFFQPIFWTKIEYLWLILGPKQTFIKKYHDLIT